MLRLELGKCYVAKDGSTTEPLVNNPNSGRYCFKDPGSGKTFMEDGRYIDDDLPVSCFDLIREWDDAETSSPTQ